MCLLPSSCRCSPVQRTRQVELEYSVHTISSVVSVICDCTLKSLVVSFISPPSSCCCCCPDVLPPRPLSVLVNDYCERISSLTPSSVGKYVDVICKVMTTKTVCILPPRRVLDGWGSHYTGTAACETASF